MAPKKKWGGKRKNAGRRPVEDKKQTISIYVRSSIIKANRGVERFKDILYELIENLGKNK